MSTAITTNIDTVEFRERFVAMCGTSNPKVISEYLGISYQAARNYLDGRVPESKVLVRFAEVTPVSIHWLLTGEGEKYVEKSEKTEAELLASVLSEIADPHTLRKIFEYISNSRIKASAENGKMTDSEKQSRTVTIAANRIRNQKQGESRSRPIAKKGP